MRTSRHPTLVLWMSANQNKKCEKRTTFAPDFAQNICVLVITHWMFLRDPLTRDDLLIRLYGSTIYSSLENTSANVYEFSVQFSSYIDQSMNYLRRFIRLSVNWGLVPGVSQARVPVAILGMLGIPPCPILLIYDGPSLLIGHGTRSEMWKKAKKVQFDMKRAYTWIGTAILRMHSGRPGFFQQPMTIDLPTLKDHMKKFLREDETNFGWGMSEAEIDAIGGDRGRNGNGHDASSSLISDSSVVQGPASTSCADDDSKSKRKRDDSPPPPIATLASSVRTKDPRLLKRSRPQDFFTPEPAQAPLNVIEGSSSVIQGGTTVVWKDSPSDLIKYFPSAFPKESSPSPRLSPDPPSSRSSPDPVRVVKYDLMQYFSQI